MCDIEVVAARINCVEAPINATVRGGNIAEPVELVARGRHVDLYRGRLRWCPGSAVTLTPQQGPPTPALIVSQAETKSGYLTAVTAGQADPTGMHVVIQDRRFRAEAAVLALDEYRVTLDRLRCIGRQWRPGGALIVTLRAGDGTVKATAHLTGSSDGRAVAEFDDASRTAIAELLHTLTQEDAAALLAHTTPAT